MKLVSIISLFGITQALKMTYYSPTTKDYLIQAPSQNHISDEDLVTSAITQLKDITQANDLDGCVSCKMRLQVGKFVALMKPELVPRIFGGWCQEMGFDDTKCHINFGYPSNSMTTLGNEFTKMLQVLGPEGLDGDLFCYYHDYDCNVLPETPDIELDKLWPPKPRSYDAPKPSGETFNVLHLSDTDIQLDYTILSEANCSQAVCCSPHSYNSVSPPDSYDYASLFDASFGLSFYQSSYESGHFKKGPFLDQYATKQDVWLPAHEFRSYSCDSPELLINNTLQIIRDFHENHLSFEFGIFTGGTVDHSDSQFVNKDQVLKSQFQVYRDISHYLPGVPLYSAIGVKDSIPGNQFPPNSFDNVYEYQWQFDFLADMWHDLDWIDFKASKQIRYNKFGYATTTSRGLKIVSLNSNVWNSKNLYAFTNSLHFDPFGIWRFLIDELIASEVNDQRVWIIAHLPPSQQSLPVPTKIFKEIIQRFSPKVIAGIFFGYDLNDQFQVIYAGNGKDLDNVLNYALIGPSITPFRGNNPAWRYYSVDVDSFDIVNSFTYYTKLNHTFINEGAEPVWEYEYLARDAYDPDQNWSSDHSLNGEFWHQAAESIKINPDINKMYTRFEYRESIFHPYFDQSCESEEEQAKNIMENDNYCKVTSFTVNDRKECMLTEDQDDYVEPKEPSTYIPLIKPYQAPEYRLVEEKEPHPEEQGNYEQEDIIKDPFDGETDITNSAKLSIKEKIYHNHRDIQKELKRRN